MDPREHPSRALWQDNKSYPRGFVQQTPQGRQDGLHLSSHPLRGKPLQNLGGHTPSHPPTLFNPCQTGEESRTVLPSHWRETMADHDQQEIQEQGQGQLRQQIQENLHSHEKSNQRALDLSTRRETPKELQRHDEAPLEVNTSQMTYADMVKASPTSPPHVTDPHGHTGLSHPW